MQKSTRLVVVDPNDPRKNNEWRRMLKINSEQLEIKLQTSRVDPLTPDDGQPKQVKDTHITIVNL